MEALAHLTVLTSLMLRGVRLEASNQHQLTKFTALTASSRLAQLHIQSGSHQPLPKRAAEHIFGAGRQLGSFRRLAVTASRPSDAAVQDDYWCLDTGDIQGIAGCCPGLKSLELEYTMHCNTKGLLSLLQLHQSLAPTQLSLSGACLTDDAGPILAQMTSLQELNICPSPAFTYKGLRHLTALHKLTSLRFNMCECCGARVLWEGSAALCEGAELRASGQVGGCASIWVSQALRARCTYVRCNGVSEFAWHAKQCCWSMPCVIGTPIIIV